MLNDTTKITIENSDTRPVSLQSKEDITGTSVEINQAQEPANHVSEVVNADSLQNSNVTDIDAQEETIVLSKENKAETSLQKDLDEEAKPSNVSVEEADDAEIHQNSSLTHAEALQAEMTAVVSEIAQTSAEQLNRQKLNEIDQSLLLSQAPVTPPNSNRSSTHSS